MPKPDYSILIIGIYGHPSHVIRFVRNLKLANPSASVSLLTDREPAVFPDEIHACLSEFIKWRISSRLIQYSCINRLINRVSSLIQILRLERNRQYDVINIHFPQSFMSHWMKHLRKMSKSIVVTPWGSDVLRVKGKRNRKQLAHVFQMTDFITVGPKGDIGKTLVNEMKIDESKFHPLAWGSETIDYISEHITKVSSEDAKRELGLESRYVITCGYNAFKEQRHEQMINAIHEIRSQLPSELILLFPVTYGFSYGTQKKDYVDKLKKQCKECGLDAVFYEDYLSVEAVFYLRRASDMFIHVQTTDAGNSTVMEYCICGSKLVHGSWMHYKWLDYSPAFYFSVDNIDHLSETVLKACNSSGMKVPHEVVEIILKRGWKAKMRLWNEFFASIA